MAATVTITGGTVTARSTPGHYSVADGSGLTDTMTAVMSSPGNATVRIVGGGMDATGTATGPGRRAQILLNGGGIINQYLSTSARIRIVGGGMTQYATSPLTSTVLVVDPLGLEDAPGGQTLAFDDTYGDSAGMTDSVSFSMSPGTPPVSVLTRLIEFGFGYGTDETVGSWTDVTAWVELKSASDTIEMSRGRGAVRSGINPGEVTFLLDNSDRRFDPTYTGGPYYGDLTPGVQVRVRTIVDGVSRGLWKGFVKSGWAQPITNGRQVVAVKGHDVFGQMAQGSAPQSAWDVAMSELTVQPDQWWRPGSDRWIDQIASMSGRHTSKSIEVDSLIDGGEKTFGQSDPDGFGLVEDQDAWVSSTNGTQWMVGAWVRFPLPADTSRVGTVPPAPGFGLGAIGPAESHPLPQPIWSQGADGAAPWDDISQVSVRAEWDGVSVTLRDAAHTLTYQPAQFVTLWDGRPHFVLVRGRGDGVVTTGGALSVHIDGKRLTPRLTRTNSSGGFSAAPLRIGGSEMAKLYSGVDAYTYVPPYEGAIDHVLVWRDTTGDFTEAEVDELASQLFSAGRLGWAGDRLDQRLDHIVRGTGMGGHLGELDTSGVVTQQGYRRAGTLALLQTIEDTEQGRIWCDRDGAIRMSRRSWAWSDDVSTTVQLTLSDVPALVDSGAAHEMVESGTVINFDPYKVTNVARVTSANGSQQTAEDAESVALIGERNAVSLSGLLHASDRQSLAIAQWIVYSQSRPGPRAEQVTFQVETNPDVLAPVAAEIDEGWLVRIVKSPPLDATGVPIGDPLDLQAHVIGVRHSWGFNTWTVTLLLDSSRARTNWFRIGSSLLGGPAVLAF